MNLLNKIKDIAGESDTNPSLFNFNSLNTHFVDSIDLILKQPSSLIMLSWWIDSTTLLYLSKKLWIDLTWLEFFYSWRPKAESELIEKITNILQIKYFKVNYPEIFWQDWFKSTFNESNSFYYSIAASFAYKNKIKYVLSGQILDDWIESISVKQL